MGVAGAALGVGGGEDGVDEHKGADDLCAEPRPAGVPRRERVGAAVVLVKVGALECLDEPHAVDGAEALGQ